MHTVIPQQLRRLRIIAQHVCFQPAVTTMRLSTLRHVPSHIERPEYFNTGQPKASPTSTHIFQPDELGYMREAALHARAVLDFACAQAVAGRSTDEVDALAHEEMIRRGVCPSPLNYHGFPKSICTSLNKVACHGQCVLFLPPSFSLSFFLFLSRVLSLTTHTHIHVAWSCCMSYFEHGVVSP